MPIILKRFSRYKATEKTFGGYIISAHPFVKLSEKEKVIMFPSSIDFPLITQNVLPLNAKLVRRILRRASCEWGCMPNINTSKLLIIYVYHVFFKNRSKEKLNQIKLTPLIG